MFALIHFPSTKVYKKNKVLNKSAIKVLLGNDKNQETVIPVQTGIHSRNHQLRFPLSWE